MLQSFLLGMTARLPLILASVIKEEVVIGVILNATNDALREVEVASFLSVMFGLDAFVWIVE
jgi:hypothetical protein